MSGKDNVRVYIFKVNCMISFKCPFSSGNVGFGDVVGDVMLILVT